MHWLLSVNLCVCLVSAITFVKVYREWWLGLGSRGSAEASIDQTHRREYCAIL